MPTVPMMTGRSPGTCTSSATLPDSSSQKLPTWPPSAKIRCPAGNMTSDAIAASASS
jgi:hypothetical protein